MSENKEDNKSWLDKKIEELKHYSEAYMGIVDEKRQIEVQYLMVMFELSQKAENNTILMQEVKTKMDYREAELYRDIINAYDENGKPIYKNEGQRNNALIMAKFHDDEYMKLQKEYNELKAENMAIDNILKGIRAIMRYREG